MPDGQNGFRCWTWPLGKVPRNFKRCKCRWSGLPHYRLRFVSPREDAQSDRCITKAQLAAGLQWPTGLTCHPADRIGHAGNRTRDGAAGPCDLCRRNGRVIGCAMGRSTRTSAKRRDADGHGFANSADWRRGALRVGRESPTTRASRGGFAEGNRANPLGRREGLANKLVSRWGTCATALRYGNSTKVAEARCEQIRYRKYANC